MNQSFFAIGRFVLFVSAFFQPQSKLFPIEQTYKVVLSEESRLSIAGKTNVNHFQCIYTQDIEPGELQVNIRPEADVMYFSNAFVRLQTIHFKCGPSQMNQDLQAFLKVKEHPTATIRLLKLQVTKDQLLDKLAEKVMSEMEVTLAGVTKKYQIPVVISKDSEKHVVSGLLDLNVCDFNLDPPVIMMGLIRVEENVKVKFKLKVSIGKIDISTNVMGNM